MSELKVSVSASALRDLLQSVTGPSHLIRELQVIRKIDKNNSIDTLLDEYNQWATGENTRPDLKAELVEAIENILSGIDQTETDSDNGWWETSTGANFGKRKLNELKNLINTIMGDTE